MIKNKIKHITGGRTRAEWLIWFHSCLNLPSFTFYDYHDFPELTYIPTDFKYEPVKDDHQWKMMITINNPSVKLPTGFDL